MEGDGDVTVVHIFDYRDWFWSWDAVMLCGARFRMGGNNETVWFTWGEEMCQACQRVEKEGK